MAWVHPVVSFPHNYRTEQKDTHRQKHEVQAAGLSYPKAPPRKKKDRNYSRVPKRCLFSFSTGVKLFVFFAAFLLVFGFMALLQKSDVRRSSDGSRVHAFRHGGRNVSPLV